MTARRPTGLFLLLAAFAVALPALLLSPSSQPVHAQTQTVETEVWSADLTAWADTGTGVVGYRKNDPSNPAQGLGSLDGFNFDYAGNTYHVQSLLSDNSTLHFDIENQGATGHNLPTGTYRLYIDDTAYDLTAGSVSGRYTNSHSQSSPILADLTSYAVRLVRVHAASESPTVSSVAFATTPLSGETYGFDEEIWVRVTFNKPVLVHQNLAMTLRIGNQDKTLHEGATAPTQQPHLDFIYHVKSGDTDTDGISLAANTLRAPSASFLPGLPVTDATGQYRVVLTHDAIATDATRKVDGSTVVTPAVTGVALVSDPVSGTTYVADEVIAAEVTFNRVVRVNLALNSPQLALWVDANNRRMTYVPDEHNGVGAVMRFEYTVRPGDLDVDGVVIPANGLSLNDGAITLSGGSNPATLTHAAVHGGALQQVNGGPALAAPTITSVAFQEAPENGHTYRALEQIFVTVTFDSPVAFSGEPKLRLDIGGTIVLMNISDDVASDNELDFKYGVRPNVSDADGASIPANALVLSGRVNEDAVEDNAEGEAFAGSIFASRDPDTAAYLAHTAVNGGVYHKVNGALYPPPEISRVWMPGIPSWNVRAHGDAFVVGETFEIVVIFDRLITVTGAPQLSLTVGTETRRATFSEVRETGVGEAAGRVAVFEYAVRPGDQDDDGISIPAGDLVLNGGSITHRHSSITNALLSHSEVADDAEYKVDGSRSLLPRGLSVQPGAPGSLDVTWEPPDVDAAAVTGYDLRQRRVGADAWSEGPTGLAESARTHTYTGLAPDTEYEVQVRARRGSDAGGWSFPARGTPVIPPETFETHLWSAPLTVGSRGGNRGYINDGFSGSFGANSFVASTFNIGRMGYRVNALLTDANGDLILRIRSNVRGTTQNLQLPGHNYILRVGDSEFVFHGTNNYDTGDHGRYRFRMPGLSLTAGQTIRVSLWGIGLPSVFGQLHADYDTDNDGLIEVDNLEKLNAIRYDLDGNGAWEATFENAQQSYNAAFPHRKENLNGQHNTVDGAMMGCPSTGCKGYELTADLDFDTNGNGMADEGDTYWNDGGGWHPIGNQRTNFFNAEFSGNGHTISNLFISRRAGSYVGLFGHTSGFLHHVGMKNVNVLGDAYVGGLAGSVGSNSHSPHQHGGDGGFGGVAASYATGRVEGRAQVGGLVGQLGGYLFASWTDVNVSGTQYLGGVAGCVFKIRGTQAHYFLGAFTHYTATGITAADGAVGASYALGRVQAREPHNAHPVSFNCKGPWNQNRHWVPYEGTNEQAPGARLNSYFNSDIHRSADAEGKATYELVLPTDYTGIFSGWNVDTDSVTGGDDPWDFGTARDYPKLRADTNGDGVFTVAEFPGQDQMPGGSTDYDTDDDNLIEISTMAQLNAIRYDPDGDGFVPFQGAPQYPQAFPDALFGMGCPDTCTGYELAADLDHDTNGNGRFDSEDWPYDGGAGFRPIGHDNDTPYSAEFHGNGHVIRNLNIHRTAKYTGLFGHISGTAYIHHVGLNDVNITSTAQDVGGLVGYAEGNQLRISANYVTGSVSGRNQTGGLVGSNQGFVRANWAEVTVNGGTNVGGLVGFDIGTVSAGYARGTTVTGTSRVNGVVGRPASGTVHTYYDKTVYTVDHSFGRTTTELQAPTGYTDIYANWNSDLDGDGNADDPWDFGASFQYPVLKADRDGDGTATWQEFGYQGRGSLVPPTAVSIESPQSSSFTVRWTPDPAVSPFAPYDLRYRVARANAWISGPRGVTGTHASVIGLARNTVYEVQVKATDADAWSDSAYGATTVPNAYYSAILTVGAEGMTARGFVAPSPTGSGFGSLTPNSFEYEGATFTLDELDYVRFVNPSGAAAWTYELSFDPDGLFPEEFELHLDGLTFSWDSRDANSSNNYVETLTADPGWSAGQRVAVSMAPPPVIGVIVTPTEFNVSEAVGQISYTVELAGPPLNSGTVTVGLDAYEQAPSSLSADERAAYDDFLVGFDVQQASFTEANWQTPQTLSVTVSDDMEMNPGGFRVIVLSNTVTGAAGTGYESVTAEDVKIVARDDDRIPELSVSSPEVREGGVGDNPTLSFRVSLSEATSRLVTVDYAISTDRSTATAGSDYETLAPGILAFQPGQTSKTITVQVIGDAVEETREERVVLEFSNLTGATFRGGGDTLRARGTILDDDGVNESKNTPPRITHLYINEGALVGPQSSVTNTLSGTRFAVGYRVYDRDDPKWDRNKNGIHDDDGRPVEKDAGLDRKCLKWSGGLKPLDPTGYGRPGVCFYIGHNTAWLVAPHVTPEQIANDQNCMEFTAIAVDKKGARTERTESLCVTPRDPTVAVRAWNRHDLSHQISPNFLVTEGRTASMSGTLRYNGDPSGIYGEPYYTNGDPSGSYGGFFYEFSGRTWDYTFPVTYQWEQEVPPGGLEVTLEGSTRGWATFRAPLVTEDTTLKFILTVTDPDGRTASMGFFYTIRDCQSRPTWVCSGARANAGGDSSAMPGEPVKLTGTVETDAGEGAGPVRLRWEQMEGPSVGLSGANGDASFVVPRDASPGTAYAFMLTATNEDGESDRDVVAVTVAEPRHADCAGPDLTGVPGQQVTLQGACGASPEGESPPGHAWSQTSGPTVTLDDATRADPSFTIPTDAAYGATLEFELTVTDEDGQSSTDTVTVTVVAPPPTACAGPDLTGAPGEDVTLQGRCSTNPYGPWHRMAHQWTQLSGPPVTLDDTTRGDPSFTLPADAADGTTLEFQLEVTDQEGQTDTDSVVVTVDSTPEATPPTACAGPDMEAQPGDAVTLEGTCSTNPHGEWWRMAHLWTQPEGQNIVLSDATKGRPTFTVPSDAAPGTVYTFTLTVTDKDDESDSDDMTVTVPGENRAPAFTEGSSATREVAENSPAGTNVGAAITATDPDAGDTLTYSLSGTDAASFGINTETGQLLTIEGVTYDYETQAIYSVTVEATDPDGASASIAVTIYLDNVNEVPAFTEGGTATREVAENSAAGTNVGAPVSATDPDAGDTLTYSLSGTDSASFGINTETGQLLTIEGVTYDYETQAIYSVTVEATDPDGASASIDVTVNLGDVNEAPVFNEGDTATREVAENSAAGVNVGAAVTATDPDAGDTLTYSLSGTDSASFGINTETGQLLTIEGVTYDYETQAIYSVTVEATDPDGASASIAVTVNLGDVNEAPDFTEGSAATRAVAENSAAGVNVGAAVTATDPDADDTLTYSLSGTDAASFGINTETGQLLTIEGVTYDYETQAIYSVTVEATDGKGGTASIAVTVTLSDVHEPTPVTDCFTDLGALSAAVEYADSWDDDECRAHHQDSVARYFQFTLAEETVVTFTLTPEFDGALYVSKDTPQNGWGTEPKSTYEDRRRIRRDNGKLVHDGVHVAEAGNDGNIVTLTLAAGVTYTMEAAGTADGGTFTISFAPQ